MDYTSQYWRYSNNMGSFSQIDCLCIFVKSLHNNYVYLNIIVLNQSNSSLHIDKYLWKSFLSVGHRLVENTDANIMSLILQYHYTFSKCWVSFRKNMGACSRMRQMHPWYLVDLYIHVGVVKGDQILNY